MNILFIVALCSFFIVFFGFLIQMERKSKKLYARQRKEFDLMLAGKENKFKEISEEISIHLKGY